MNEDKVQCQICMKWFKQISTSHLKKEHNITLKEYKKIFPNVETTPQWLRNAANKDRIKDREIIICKYCNNEFEALPSDNRVFCSRKCQDKWKSENLIGKNNPLYIERKKSICEYCGKEFDDKSSRNRRFCSKKCSARWHSRNKSGEFFEYKKIICEYCGKEFISYPSRDPKFCSPDCYHSYVSENIIGENNPLYVERKIFVCKWCGKEFKDIPSQDRIFCSIECHAMWQSVNNCGENNGNYGKGLLGELNGNWKGGISFDPYCEKFNKAKKKEVRNKYNNCDYLTGIHRDICNKDKNGKIQELSVHHFDYNKQQGCNDIPWKLIPVSRSHNSIFNKNRPFWKKLILYSLKYDQEYYENREFNIFKI